MINQQTSTAQVLKKDFILTRMSFQYTWRIRINPILKLFNGS